MRRLLALILLTTTACIPPALRVGALPDKTNCIAILPFDLRYELAGDMEMLSEFLALELHSKGARGVVGPRETAYLFAQSNDPLPPTLDPFWARKIGRSMGVDGVIFGSLSQIPVLRGKENRAEVYVTLDAYLLDTKSGEIQWTYGTQEVVDNEKIVERLGSYAGNMTQALLSKRTIGEPFGRPHCWKSPPEVTVAKRTSTRQRPVATPTPSAEVKLSPTQMGLLNTLRSGGVYTLDATHFQKRGALFTRKALTAMQDLRTVLKAAGAPQRIQITAHVDTSAQPHEDLTLSKDRAQAIKRYLKFLGIEANRVIIVGAGSTQPLVPNINQTLRKRNQRVEIKKVRGATR